MIYYLLLNRRIGHKGRLIGALALLHFNTLKTIILKFLLRCRRISPNFLVI